MFCEVRREVRERDRQDSDLLPVVKVKPAAHVLSDDFCLRGRGSTVQPAAPNIISSLASQRGNIIECLDIRVRISSRLRIEQAGRRSLIMT